MRRDRLSNLIRSDPMSSEDDSPRLSTNSTSYPSFDNSPYCSPLSMASSPFVNSPWYHSSAAAATPITEEPSSSSLVGSIIREHGHLYSIAVSNGLLYTGSDSKNIRVWKNLAEFSGFKSSSGLVKAIVVSGDRIFTGHQDGKIRIWKVSPKDSSIHKRIGTLPRLKDFLKSSINPSAYVQVRRHRKTVWLRHFDAVSSLSLDEEAGILYSGSWDKTFKAWRVSDSKCLESVNAHDDAINSLLAGFDGLVFTGSADGTVKVWRREFVNKKSGATKHVLVRTLLSQESAVTSLAMSRVGGVVYCGSSDGAINCWEVGMGGRTIVPGGMIRGHKMAVLCLATAGRLVLSGSADRTIRVWRRGEGGAHFRVSVLTGHTGPIKCLAVEEAGKDGGGWVVYSGSLDKSVKVWRVSDGGREAHVTQTKQRK